MATHDYDIANQSGAAFRTDLNNALAAIQSNNSNSSSPSTTVAYQWWADTNAAIFKIRNSSNNAWINLFTLAGGIDVDAASTFSADVTFDGATSGRDIVFDRSDNALEFADNAKAKFGAGGDFQVYHDGTDSFIDNATGELKVLGDTIRLKAKSNNENMIAAFVNGAAQLYFDNSKKFETWTSGARLPLDNGVLALGAGDDLRLWHNATNSIIRNATGQLQIQSNDLRLGNFNFTETYLKALENGAVELFHDNTKKFETTSAGIAVSGKIGVGSSAANNSINVIGALGNAQTTLFYGFGTIDLTSGSDERIKNNIVPTAKGLDDILKLRIVDFTYTPEYAADSTTVRTGGIAQEWQKVDPNLVNAENEDLLFIEYKRVIPHLIKAVQELSAKVAVLEAA